MRCITCCFFRAFRSRLFCSYLNFPKSMIRHTGGRAVGETLDEVEALLLRERERFADAENSDLRSVLGDDADLGTRIRSLMRVSLGRTVRGSATSTLVPVG